MDKISFFSADYRDGRVHLGGKSYPAGTFATHLLNQFYTNDTAARLSVYKQHGWNVAEQLSIGYLKETEFLAAETEIGYILDTLPDLKPFHALDIPSERSRISGLFSEKNAKQIIDFFNRRAAVESKEQAELDLDLLPSEYDEALFKACNTLISDITNTLNFYNAISDDMQRAHKGLTEFSSRVDEAERFDEEHLLPIALEVFGSVPFPVTTEYVPLKKASRSKTATLARRLCFDSYYSFVMTDFFEGLHYGHYPRMCGICKKYFLMTSAARQKYCTGYAPFKLKGKAITCRKYAARINRKELAAGNPVIRIYKNRCSVLRMERKRGTVTEEFAAAALDLAKERMQRAKEDAEYANSQYESDMSREKLYAEVDKQLK